MGVIRWEDLPARRNGSGTRNSATFDEIAEYLAELSKRPGQWAVIEEYPENKGTTNRSHKRRTTFLAVLKRHGITGFEFKVRNGYQLFARKVPKTGGTT